MTDERLTPEQHAERIEELEAQLSQSREMLGISMAARELHSCGAYTDRLRKALEQARPSCRKLGCWCPPEWGFAPGDGTGLPHSRVCCEIRDTLRAAPAPIYTSLPPRANPPMIAPHDTVPVRCVVDVDKGVAPLVEYLNSRDGVRTLASCEGGLCYGPQVMVSWLDRDAFDFLAASYPLINIETGEPVEFGRESVAYIARREEWQIDVGPEAPAVIIDNSELIPDELCTVTVMMPVELWNSAAVFFAEDLVGTKVGQRVPSLSLIARRLQEKCPRCHGNKTAIIPAHLRTLAVVDTGYIDPCPECGGTGKQSVPGARLAEPSPQIYSATQQRPAHSPWKSGTESPEKEREG